MNWMNQCHRYQYGRAGSERYWVVFRELIISLKRTHTPVAVDYAPVGSRLQESGGEAARGPCQRMRDARGELCDLFRGRAIVSHAQQVGVQRRRDERTQFFLKEVPKFQI